MASTEFVVICRWCKQVKSIEGKWEKIPVPEEIRITYGICPECDKRTEEEIEK